jgi:hypothetical protein
LAAIVRLAVNRSGSRCAGSQIIPDSSFLSWDQKRSSLLREAVIVAVVVIFFVVIAPYVVVFFFLVFVWGTGNGANQSLWQVILKHFGHDQWYAQRYEDSPGSVNYG